jgi:hypothetical protein
MGKRTRRRNASKLNEHLSNSKTKKIQPRKNARQRTKRTNTHKKITTTTKKTKLH